MKKYVILWLPMVVLGFINGSFRTLVLSDEFDDHTARQISVLTLIALLSLYVYFIRHRLAIRDSAHAWRIGFFWAALTILFETALGLLASGLTFRQIIAEYDLIQGKFWPFVLVAIIALPVLFFKRR